MLTDTTCVVRSDRQKIRPWGLNGGGEGAPSQITLTRGDETIELPTKTVIEVPAGASLRYMSPSSGGWGDPADREAQSIAADVSDGKITAAYAAEVWGWQG
jgi:N-methylhydantoinase B